jgi:hypothetical protein
MFLCCAGIQGTDEGREITNVILDTPIASGVVALRSSEGCRMRLDSTNSQMDLNPCNDPCQGFNCDP